MFESARDALFAKYNAAPATDQKIHHEKLEDTVYIYHKQIGPYWVLCDKFDWPTVWLPKSMEKEPSNYYIMIGGEPYRFGWYLQGKRMKNLQEVSDLAPMSKHIRNEEVPPELLEVSKGQQDEAEEETPDSFLQRKKEIEEGIEASHRATFSEVAISSMATSDKVKRLKEIREEMIELMHEAKSLVRGTSEEQRFYYPYGNIMQMLGSEKYPSVALSLEVIINHLEQSEMTISNLSKSELIQLWKDSMDPHKDVDLDEKQLQELDAALRKHGIDPESL